MQAIDIALIKNTLGICDGRDSSRSLVSSARVFGSSAAAADLLLKITPPPDLEELAHIVKTNPEANTIHKAWFDTIEKSRLENSSPTHRQWSNVKNILYADGGFLQQQEQVKESVERRTPYDFRSSYRYVNKMLHKVFFIWSAFMLDQKILYTWITSIFYFLN